MLLPLAGCGVFGGRREQPPAPSTSSTPPPSSAPSSGKGGYYLDDGPGANPPADIDSIPDAVPRVEPLHKGAMRPYAVMGRNYVPMTALAPYRARGVASWYGRRYHGKQTSTGELYDMYGMSAAHPTLPLPSYVRVTNLKNNRSLIVRVNDRGPFHEGRVIDLSVRAAQLLGFYETGTTRVKIDYVGKASLGGSDDTKLAATLRGPGVSPQHAAVMVASAAPVSPAPQTSKPYMKEYFDPTIANRGSLPAQTLRANDSETPMVARRVATTAEVARATQTALQQPAQPAGPMLASSRSVPALAPAPRTVASADAPSSFESRFAPAGNSTVGAMRSDPVSAYAPSSSGSGAVLMGRGLY